MFTWKSKGINLIQNIYSYIAMMEKCMVTHDLRAISIAQISVSNIE